MRIQKKVLSGKAHGRRPVGRPRMKWEGLFSADKCEDEGDQHGTWISGGELLKRPAPDTGSGAVEDKKKKE
jgi:hypothetical protein